MSFRVETGLDALIRLGCPLGMSVGEPELDALLKPMLIPLKTVEICGDPGTGKSMLCYTLAVEALAARPDAIVFWLDSNGTFSAHKLMEIYRTRKAAEEEVEESDVLSRVLTKRVYNDEELAQALQGVIAMGEDEEKAVPVAAVFIDTVGGALEETSWTLKKGGRARQEAIVRQLAQLKRLLGTTVVCTNRIVTAADGTYKAALGAYWNQTITQRIIMYKTPSGRFEAAHFPSKRVTDNKIMRTPLIKFVGARMPRANWAAVAAQPQQAAAAARAAPAASSISMKKLGPVIDESQLPMRFRRPVIDPYEVAAINNGGAYGLVLEEPKKAGGKK